jgi:uncharacterized protein (DUF983 family)
MGEGIQDEELRTCPRCGERRLATVELTSGVRDVCLTCGYYRPADNDGDARNNER